MTDASSTPSDRDLLVFRALLVLFAFFAPDGHLHAAVGADRAAAGRFAQRVILALRAVLPLDAPFEPLVYFFHEVLLPRGA